jgi:hypothetical protein
MRTAEQKGDDGTVELSLIVVNVSDEEAVA